MDRVTAILLLSLLTGSVSAEDIGWLGKAQLLFERFKGSLTTSKRQPFGTIQDEGSNNGKISLAVDSHTDNRVAGYKLHYGTETGHYVATWDCRKTLERICTVSGLTNGTTYYFAATAYGLNPAIESTYSNEVSGAP